MAWVTKNLNKYERKRRKKFSITFISIPLRRKMKEDSVFVTQTKTIALNVRLEQIHFRCFRYVQWEL